MPRFINQLDQFVSVFFDDPNSHSSRVKLQANEDKPMQDGHAYPFIQHEMALPSSIVSSTHHDKDSFNDGV